MSRDEVVENGLLRCWPQPDHPCSKLLHIFTNYHKDQRPNQPDSEFLYILSHFDQNTLHCITISTTISIKVTKNEISHEHSCDTMLIFKVLFWLTAGSWPHCTPRSRWSQPPRTAALSSGCTSSRSGPTPQTAPLSPPRTSEHFFPSRAFVKWALGQRLHYRGVIQRILPKCLISSSLTSWIKSSWSKLPPAESWSLEKTLLGQKNLMKTSKKQK